MTHGSLFSGIGGFDLASEWMGWENKFHCEWNEFGQKVLHHYWPQAELFTDITKSDFTKYANKIDILTGGFPCQPYSSAGKRLGKEDARHLWPEMLRAIREIQPRWVVGENVRGLTNWNGGVVFDEVQADLEAKGYEVTPFLLPACAVNAPHRRDRIWFIANANLYGQNKRNGNDEINTSERGFDALGDINEGNEYGDAAKTCSSRQQTDNFMRKSEESEFITGIVGKNIFADTMYIRLQQCENGAEVGRGQSEMGGEGGQSSNAIETNGKIRDVTDTDGFGLWGQGNGIRESKFISEDSKRSNWENFPTVSPICTGDDGISDRLDGITFSKWRNESIKAGGNAIVPQVVYQIFKAIEQYERIRNTIQNQR